MPKLKNRDVQKVIQLFESELTIIPRLSKVDRMKLRRRIVNVVQPALKSPITTPQMFMGTVEDKLSGVIRLFRDGYGFRIKLNTLVTALFKKADELRKAAFTPEWAETEKVDD